jgi:hypothetical protein
MYLNAKEEELWKLKYLFHHANIKIFKKHLKETRINPSSRY